MLRELTVKTDRRSQLIDITDRIESLVSESGIDEGECLIFVPHTTAAVTINEKADPDVAIDISAALERIVPGDLPFRHSEGNSDAHVKSSLTGISAHLLISGGSIVLGVWQAVFFCEFDGPRTRRCLVRIS